MITSDEHKEEWRVEQATCEFDELCAMSATDTRVLIRPSYENKRQHVEDTVY
jgi:hypothetical protein